MVKIIDIKKWVSASSVHNYMLDDPILDYFKMYGTEIGLCDDSAGVFLQHIFSQGNLFEKIIVEQILDKKELQAPQPPKDPQQPQWFKQISYNRNESLLHETFDKTVAAIKDRVPVIYQGTLHDYTNKLYGTPDLIIRMDYLNKLVPGTIIDKPEHKDQYTVIDIKFRCLELTANGINILNNGRTKANKGQLIFYNNLLNKVLTKLGLETSKYCYILGRGFKIKKYTKGVLSVIQSDDCFQKLGLIEPLDYDSEITAKLDSAIKWLKDLQTNGSQWYKKYGLKNTPDLPQELRPNMCNKYDAPFTAIKKYIAEEQEELTLLCHVTYKNRIEANNNGIFKISDPNLTLSSLGLRKSNKTIDKMIQINKKDCSDVIDPALGSDISVKEFFKKQNVEFFIDFETVNICNLEQPSTTTSSTQAQPSTTTSSTQAQPPTTTQPQPYTTTTTTQPQPSTTTQAMTAELILPSYKQYTVMIGLIARTDTKCEYYNFLSTELSTKGTLKIFSDMLDVVNKFKEECGGDYSEDVKVYHWAPIESYIYKKLQIVDPQLQNLNFCDVHEYFKAEPFVLKGMYNYSLKTVAGAFLKNDLFKNKESWSGIDSGLDASILLERCYSKNDNTLFTKNNKILEEIVRYNRIDCNMVLEIVDFIRNNY